MAKFAGRCSSIIRFDFMKQNVPQRQLTWCSNIRQRLNDHLVNTKANGKETNSHPLKSSNIQYTSLNSATSQANVDNTVCQEHSLKVPSRGAGLSLATSIDTSILSSDPGAHQNLDEAFVRLFTASDPKPQTGEPLLYINQKNDNMLLIQCEATMETKKVSDFTLNVEVPIVYNVKASAIGNARLDIGEFIETKYIDLETAQGDVKTTKLRSENIRIKTDSGNVTCGGALQGNISINTDTGNITSNKRFIGPIAELQTDKGDIKISSSYSDVNRFFTNSGSLNLKNVHNESHINVSEEGNVIMQGVDGCTNIFINKGDLDIQISRLTNESKIVVNEGNVNLKLSDSNPMNVSIDAKEIVTDEKFCIQGKIDTIEETSSMSFTTTAEPNLSSESLFVSSKNGKVSVELQDWATSIGFKLPSMS